MRRNHSLVRFAALRALLGLSLLGCTEDPVLDRVGGTGTTIDARPPCSDAVPDGQPRFLPCDVEAVLVAKCQRCHNSKAVLDRCYPAKTCVRGPFPLLTWSDTHGILGERPIFEAMHDAVQSDFMPFQVTGISPPVAGLTAGEKATLLSWTAACAPPGSHACSVPEGGALDGSVSGDK